MNTAAKFSLRAQAPLKEPLEGRDASLAGAARWKDAWIDCLIQACVAAPWIIVSAIGRLLFQP
jgi:hypothetical protein